MTLSIAIPVVPIKLTIGKEKKEDAPVATPVAAPVSPSQRALDGRDFAIVCATMASISGVK